MPGARDDYYEILGVPRDASATDIKKAYRQLVRKYHPDANPGNRDAEEHFKRVNEAYEVLGDAQKRAQYDQFGTVGDMSGGGSPFEGFGGMGDLFGDLFESVFSGGTGRRRASPNAPRQGDDLELRLSVTLEEAATGTKKAVEIPRWETCETCRGSGAAPGTKAETCETCRGSGQVETRQQTPFGQFVSVNTCPRCGGTGKFIRTPCPDCNGQGRMRKRKSVDVRIPAGVDTGTRLRISGEGEAGINGGPAGDLYLVVEVAEHRDFKRDGADLHCRLTVTFPQVALGCTVPVRTLTGESETLEIPAGTQPGKVFRIRGKGMPRLRGARGTGDLFVHTVVDVPTKLTDKQRALLEALAKEMNVEVADQGLFAKFKTLFGG